MYRLILGLFLMVTLMACRNPGGTDGGSAGVAGTKYPYGKKVPDKEGLVYSPYSDSDVYIDIRGFDRGTEVRDPWTGKIFLVP